MAYDLKYEDLINNYEYKVVKKMVMQEYPWIKDMFIKDPQEINKYNTIYVDFIVDPYELAEEIDGDLAGYVTRLYFNTDYRTPFLSIFFDRGRDEAKKIQDDIEKLMVYVNQSPAIPASLRLPHNRKLQPGAFIYPRQQD